MLSAGSDYKENKRPTSSDAQTRLARLTVLPFYHLVTTQMPTAQDIVEDLSFFLTTLASFCLCIIAAKLSVNLPCCLK